jgi:hypothetical protein
MAEMRIMSKKLITERKAIAQRAKAAKMTVEAFVANLPDYRVYQDYRKALAMMLAKEVDSGRLSEQDVATWLETLPNIFTDTLDSAEKKWKLLGITHGTRLGNDLGVVKLKSDGKRHRVLSRKPDGSVDTVEANPME